jgi:hypothetical protein
MNEVEPSCPEYYMLNKDNCMCVQKPKTVSKRKAVTRNITKRKRCPKGYRINHKDGLCYNVKTGKVLSEKRPSISPSLDTLPDLSPIPVLSPIEDKSPSFHPDTPPQGISEDKSPSFHPDTPPQSSSKSRKKKSKRCPKGTRKNRKTGLCEDKITGKVVNSTSESEVVVVNDFLSSEPDQATMRETVHAIVNKPQTKRIRQAVENNPSLEIVRQADRELSDELRREMIRTKSFSPTLNKYLVSLRRGNYHNIFGCGVEEKLEQISDNIGNIQIRIGTNPDGSDKCVDAKSNEGIEMMLKNLKLIEQINCMNIIAPMQVQSNCWFNAFFMQFFISDKGRKFTRFLRQLMIEGKSLNGSVIKPAKLRDSLLLLNMAIEACYNYDGSTRDIALALNTNSIIKGIAKSIPRSFKDKSLIKDVGKPGNPFSYYTALMDYLTSTTQTSFPIMMSVSSHLRFYELFTRKSINFDFFPHIITITTHSGRITRANNKWLHSEDPNIKIQSKFTIHTGKDPSKKATYELDSACVRDTKHAHFCSTLVCNKKEYGFDGGSFSRMSPFEWKKLINVDKNWTFKGSVWRTGDYANQSIYWNFKKSYVTYVYFRVK